MQKRTILTLAIAIPLVCLLAIGVYFLPPVHDRLAWRIDTWKSQIYYWINPPEKVVFVPQAQTTPTGVTLIPTSTPTRTLTPTGSATPTATPPGATATRTPTTTVTPSPTSVPTGIRLKGLIHEYQKWNNCGPATLSMALSFWGWKDGQVKVADWVKPNIRDKNVMPYELEAFVEANTSLKAVVRVGGNAALLKQLLAAGFPVVIEKGFEPDDSHGWMGHYEAISGYDDAKKVFIAQDAYIMPDLPVTYADIEKYWQQFNYIYLVIYPPEREAEVLALLGPDSDETANFQNAALIASNEVYSLTGPAQFYAWYNRGTNLVKLQDYAGAAAAYDEAFNIYPSIPEKHRPWRMIWYQTGPYFAYFYTGRYYDVINLATTAVNNTDEAAFEESWYWRAMAKNALGDSAGAIDDLRISLKWHPNFGPSLDLLNQLGAEP